MKKLNDKPFFDTEMEGEPEAQNRKRTLKVRADSRTGATVQFGVKNTFENLFPWFAVFFATGIVAYFSLPIEPSIYIGVIASSIAAVLWIAGRKDIHAFYIIGFVLCACAGFSVASVRTHWVQAPVLKGALFDAEISGEVKDARLFFNSQQVLLKNVTISGVETVNTPTYVRVNIGNLSPVFKTGDKIAARAHLMPPTLPQSIGAYNFARTAYFDKIGAIGRTTGQTDLVERTDETSSLENMRKKILGRVKSLLPAESAAVVVPLIIGEQGVVPPDIYDLYRKTGIAHVLSVSGLHLTLIAGFVFFFIRFLLSLIPAVSLRFNTKKAAAVIAMLMTFSYLLISGMAVPAIRSFIMVFVVLLGVLFNRNAISLRSVAIAAIMILAIWPESILGASFQLSFMAVVAIVSLYESVMAKFKSGRIKEPGIIGKVWIFVIGLVCIDILASMATAPYTIFHFNQYATYGLVGNMLTSSLFTFWVMPMLLAGVLLMPIGWDGIFIKAAGACIEWIHEICRWIVSWPHASLTLPAMTTAGLVIISVGLLMLFLIQNRWRLTGFLVIGLGCLTYFMVQKPLVLVSEGGKAFAVRQEDGQLILSNVDNRFVTDVWLRRNGQDPEAYDPADLFTKTSVRLDGHKISFSTLDCANAEITFVMKYSMGGCAGIVVNRADLLNKKTHEIFSHDGVLSVKSVVDELPMRPWNPYFILAQEAKTFYDIKEFNEE